MPGVRAGGAQDGRRRARDLRLRALPAAAAARDCGDFEAQTRTRLLKAWRASVRAWAGTGCETKARTRSHVVVGEICRVKDDRVVAHPESPIAARADGRQPDILEP